LSLKLSFIKCGVGGKSTEGAEDSMPKVSGFRFIVNKGMKETSIYKKKI